MNKHLAEPVMKSSLVTFSQQEKFHQICHSLLKPLLPSHLFHQQGHLDHIELIIKLLNLLQILLLHLPPRIALLTIIALLGKQQLVDDNGMRIDLIRRQLLDHPLRLIQRQELGNANADKGRHIRILELRIHLPDRLPQRFHLLQQLVQILPTRQSTPRPNDRVEHRSKLRRQLRELRERLLKHSRELEEAQRMPRRRRIEDDDLVGQRLDLFKHFGKRHGLIHPGYLQDALALAKKKKKLPTSPLHQHIIVQEANHRSEENTHTKSQILHHPPHPPCRRHRLLRALPALLQQILNTAIRIDFHGTEISVAFDEAGLLAELLAEGVGQVVGRVGGDEEDGFADAGHLDGEGAGGGGFADAAFAADEDPAEGLLGEEGGEGGGEGVGVGVEDGGGHGGWWGGGCEGMRDGRL